MGVAEFRWVGLGLQHLLGFRWVGLGTAAPIGIQVSGLAEATAPTEVQVGGAEEHSAPPPFVKAELFWSWANATAWVFLSCRIERIVCESLNIIVQARASMLMAIFSLSPQLISSLCGGRLEGDHVGSTEVTFYPQAIQGGKLLADTQTAGYGVGLFCHLPIPVICHAELNYLLLVTGCTSGLLQ